ncbi:uncharacterized protein LOC130748575 [Lotus japonicus]|uniref:uncharacterized protein LOC130748575 n=1 Tax=Lotus japonicus TaxID=34305 RepID=UPI00258B7E1E|nr:uncharacterized protein LOC130748575 [Lotus japonicus]
MLSTGCASNIYMGILEKKYPGAEMKQALWRAARASTLPEWYAAMEVMKELNEAAFQDMMNLPPKMWTRSAYSRDTQCDLQVNNMCEAFNRAILEYRDKPIITLLEGLKFYLNNRIVKQKQLMLRWRTALCPMIQQKLEDSKRNSDKWFANWMGDEYMSLFEVSRDNEKYSVNLESRSCACRRWDLSGIPCAHAVASMWFGRRVPEDYVHSSYRKQTFIDTYSHLILPNNGPKLWV